MPQKSKESDVQLAVQAKCRNPELSWRKLGRIYKCSPDIIQDRKQPRAVTNMAKRKLTKLEEDTIARRIIELDSRAFPPRMRYVQEMANILLRVRDASPVGKNWTSNFVRRRPDLRSRLNRRIDYMRAFNEDPITYRAWFKLVEDTIAKHDLPPPVWTTKTPTNTTEAESQSTLIKNSVQMHHNSSPTHILDSIDSIAKATHAMMHDNALLRRENEELRETNHILSKRRRKKNKQLL